MFGDVHTHWDSDSVRDRHRHPVPVPHIYIVAHCNCNCNDVRHAPTTVSDAHRDGHGVVNPHGHRLRVAHRVHHRLAVAVHAA